jgi:hypothetical protein
MPPAFVLSQDQTLKFMSEVPPPTLLESRVTNDTPFKERPNLQNQSDNSDPKVGSALW